MITLLTLAVVLAQPCMVPRPQEHHRHHKTLVSAPMPQQSCIVPPVPMCFREPAPEPDIEPLAAPLVYYTVSQASDSPAPAVELTQLTGYSLLIGGEITSYSLSGGTVTGVTPRYSPPILGSAPWNPQPCGPTECCHGAVCAPVKTPEIDPASAVGGLTLLSGLLTIIRSKRQ